MPLITKIYNKLRRFAKRCFVMYYRQMSRHRISWSLIKLVDCFGSLQLASAALTYHTLFAIVPVMALMTAIAKGLGYDEIFLEMVRNFLQGQEAISDGLIQYTDSYLSNTKVTMWLGVGIGLALLLYSVFSIFRTIDATFNILWNEKPRSFQKQLKTFAFVLVLPFAIIMALALWWSLSSIFNDTIIKEINVLIVSVSTYILLLFAAYKLIPNTVVETKYAAFSAIACGLIFALMQYFSYYIISSFNYRSIYGDLASLMIFVLLIYFSWTICLAGSKWNYFLQNADRQEDENEYKAINNYYHKFLCMLIIERIESVHPFSSHFDSETLALNAQKEYALPAHLTQHIIQHLRHKRVIFGGKGETLHLSKRYCGRTVRQLLADLDTAGRNSDVISTLSDIHNNPNLAALWQEITNNSDSPILDTPVREILGNKKITK
ncbi:MAG: YihY/virulence factor BrkB family protein [Bacteroidaceae bacterium]|nr:YihY/virulence factor BrkB family protein [Bacteroidaceae bacterium]MBR3854838.1 YihY/virulence factor BrkB family protein [Bacteroidaceae bacterium]